MTPWHHKSISEWCTLYSSHENTACTLNHRENHHVNSHSLFFTFLFVFVCVFMYNDTVRKGSMEFSVDIFNVTTCGSNPPHHVLPTDKPPRQSSTTRWGSFRDRLTVVDSAFEIIQGLRREYWQWGRECVDVVVSYGCVWVMWVPVGDASGWVSVCVCERLGMWATVINE